MLKGCIQLSSRPLISNTVNMVPVDHVARVVVASSLHPPSTPQKIVQVTSHPRFRFYEFLSCLEKYGYTCPEVPYPDWRDALNTYVSDGGANMDDEQHALMPLFHFVTNDLPANTRASELDDANAVEVLRRDAEWTGEDLSAGSAVTQETMGRYIAYLCEIGFLPRPGSGKGTALPKVELNANALGMGGIGGRGGEKR
jgi:L-aminoadipate-semialdehyde dehydrogenase